MNNFALSFWIVIICIFYVKSIDFIDPTSPINCRISGEDCNLNCTTVESTGCVSATITLYNNANFNLYCTNGGCYLLRIYAYNVTNMQLIMGYDTGSTIHLFVEGNQSNTVNLYCQEDFWACSRMKIRLLAPNLNFNIYCQYRYACGAMFISGKLYKLK